MSSFSSVTSMVIEPNKKLKDLPFRETNQLINILNRNNCWQDLAAVITHPDDKTRLLFNSDSIGVLENQWKCGKSPAEEMLFFWSRCGRNLPNVDNLINFLEEAGLSRAASDVRRTILKVAENSDSTTIVNIPQPNNNDYEEADIIAEALSDVNIEDLTIFSYRDLQSATRNFSSENTIGQGAFGTVYRAIISGSVAAIKKLKNPVDKQFITELNILTRYRHENLLPLLGCSLNGPTFCLVYEYMVNGSLQERLACIGNSEPLPWDIRLKIAYGSALGINHLHTAGKEPMVHRDIKSANILLDENLVPKVGDFGLVRIGESRNSTLMPVTENVYGTTVYMASEAFRGDVSIKLDTFSFGVVLLELITGLPPIDDAREDKDLISHMQNCDDILTMLDPRTDWNPSAAKELYEISKRCLKETKRERPTIFQILDDLKACLSHIPDND